MKAGILMSEHEQEYLRSSSSSLSHFSNLPAYPVAIAHGSCFSV